MNVYFKHIFSDKIISYGSVLWGIIFIAGLLLIALGFTQLPPFLPLFNQMPWGVSRLASREQIFIPSFIALLIFAVNLLFAVSIYEKMPLMARILSLTSLFIIFLVFLLIIKIMLLVG